MEKKNAKTKIYNVIIMDRSGSMWSIQQPAIQGFNEVLGGVKVSAEKFSDTQEHRVTLVLFDSGSIDSLYWNADPSEVPILTPETYVPRAATPLYDAMGRTLTRLEWELQGDTDHSVVVTVITDGYENSSCEYNRSAIKALVEHLQEKGWSFAYVGTDHDVHGVSVSLSIKNVIEFQKTGEETRASFCKERRAREKWAEDLHSFSLDCPDASLDEKIRFRKEKAAHYYDEDPASSESREK